MIALFLALIIVLGAGVEERGAFAAPRDVLTGREFLDMFLRQARAKTSHQRLGYHQSENELIDRNGSNGGGAIFVDQKTATKTTTATPTTPSPPLTTLNFLDSPSTTDPSLVVVESTTLPPATEPPQASQIVAVSVSSSVVRQRPATLYEETQDEPSFSAAVQSHFSVDEGSLTIQRKDHQSQASGLDDPTNSGASIGASSHFTVERTQDGEKTSLVVRQNNGEASSHFSIRQSHSPARLIHHHLTTTMAPVTTTTTEDAVPAVVHEVSRLEKVQDLEIEKTTGIELAVAQQAVQHESLSEHLGKLNKGNDKRTDVEFENKDKEEGIREERTSFSIARDQKTYEPTYHSERKEERTSYSIGSQIARQPKHSPGGWEVPEANYEVDEAVSVMTNGRAHGIQPQSTDQQQQQDDQQQQAKSGYVVEGRNFRKYRVEEKTPDGFIVGEYGVVSHDDGSLRGVRYTADSNINPRLIYDALVKFLSLK